MGNETYVTLTVQDRSLGNHLLDMVLRLRENEEDVCNTAFDNLSQFPILVQDST